MQDAGAALQAPSSGRIRREGYLLREQPTLQEATIFLASNPSTVYQIYVFFHDLCILSWQLFPQRSSPLPVFPQCSYAYF